MLTPPGHSYQQDLLVQELKRRCLQSLYPPGVDLDPLPQLPKLGLDVPFLPSLIQLGPPRRRLTEEEEEQQEDEDGDMNVADPAPAHPHAAAAPDVDAVP